MTSPLGDVVTAGRRVRLEADLGWVRRLLQEGLGGALEAPGSARPDVVVRVPADSTRPDVSRMEPIGRRAWCDPARQQRVVVADAAGSGFLLDLAAGRPDDVPVLTMTWAPSLRDRALHRALRSRFHLLARSALVTFPALWAASRQGGVPLHAGLVTLPAGPVLLTGPSGVGKTTLATEVSQRGGQLVGDNLLMYDGQQAWPVVEPVRSEEGTGRRMPHGRREGSISRPAPGATAPVALVTVVRGSSAGLRRIAAPQAARRLIASTYAAGELRRLWPYLATLGWLPGATVAHPDVTAMATALSEVLPCYELRLGASTHDAVPHLMALHNDEMESLAWS